MSADRELLLALEEITGLVEKHCDCVVYPFALPVAKARALLNRNKETTATCDAHTKTVLYAEDLAALLYSLPRCSSGGGPFTASELVVPLKPLIEGLENHGRPLPAEVKSESGPSLFDPKAAK